MRYLNKIIFINSAGKSVRYAEIELDGNLHFIGTQGVGKSTLLRAILFFYNGNTLKLGIPREKENYNNYYYPYQNSYIIYEVVTETGKFCVLTFKAQGRVAFRFFDSEYDKKFFIDNDGKAFESWDRIRDAFGTRVYSSRMVTSYDEYRNIIYGNNKGLTPEFRKYAILESRQYQNIPRTISNVFLNAKLDAEFVKETIIKSLNEEEIKIDLTVYAQSHLRDFESNLNDIRKWTDKPANGQSKVEKEANKAIEIYGALNFLKQQEKDLAGKLGFAYHQVRERLPEIENAIGEVSERLSKTELQLSGLADKFQKILKSLNQDIGALNGKLAEIKKKKEGYVSQNISELISRVNEKPNILLKKEQVGKNLKILTAAYTEINQRFEALVQQLKNQLEQFINMKNSEREDKRSEFLNFKEKTNHEYEEIIDAIEKQSEEQINTAFKEVGNIENQIHQVKLKETEIRVRRFYQKEIESFKTEIIQLNESIRKTETDILRAEDKMKTLRREWELEEADTNSKYSQQQDKLKEKETTANSKIEAIKNKIEKSKGALYGWLNENVPNWELTIGKVIDEETVLFSNDLNPRKLSGEQNGFYGIQIDAEKIKKEVKTVTDLEQEIANFQTEIDGLQRQSVLNQKEKEETLARLNNRFQPKIKEQREQIQERGYQKEQHQRKIEKTKISLDELQAKALKEKEQQLQSCSIELNKLNEQKIGAEEVHEKLKEKLSREVKSRKKEREQKIIAKEEIFRQESREIDIQKETEKKTIDSKIYEIKYSQKQELNTKGADTERINLLETEISNLQQELDFIENNSFRVVEYNKDKRELFDREDEFKNERSLRKKDLDTEEQKYNQQKGIHKRKQQELADEQKEQQRVLNDFREDIEAFEQFSKQEFFVNIQEWVESFSETNASSDNCRSIINELNQTETNLLRRNTGLQEAVNKFTGNFQEDNLFKFKVRFQDKEEFYAFAEMLKEFIDEQKIKEYQKRIEERFANIIRQIGKETNELISKEGEIGQVIREINNDFIARNFVGAIRSMELKTTESSNRIFQILVQIKNFNEENTFNLGEPDLFSTNNLAKKNEQAIGLLKDLIREMAISKAREITLSDSFELLFRIVENNNDTGWVEKLSNVGSEGTDVLAKAMINIMLLNVFKEKVSKKGKNDFRLHCMMDEIGKLHPTNVKGILKFANDRNILLINSSPTTYNAADYRYTYLLTRDSNNITTVKLLVKKITPLRLQQTENTA